VWPGDKERGLPLVGLRPGAGAAGHCQAAPPSSAASCPEPPVPRCVVWKKGENCMLQAYVLTVSNVSEVCCKCFQMNVAKVDGVLQWLYTYVASVRFQSFICVFRRMSQVCLSGCCICFTHILQVFYLNVAYVCNGFQTFSGVFFPVFHKHVSSVSSIFRRILQVLHLDVLKLDQVLHMEYA
jgi:hypothetical protein